MKITKLEKESLLNSCSTRITVEITIEPTDLANFDYEGWDLFPDEMIPDLLVAVGRMYAGKIKRGKIVEKLSTISVH